ncbi:MAG TPA: hypothetical protein VGH33_16560 [Isosphaeraceae bacterium]
MLEGETPLQAALRRASFKEDIRECSAGLARGVSKRLGAERDGHRPEVLRRVFDNLVKHVLSVGVAPGVRHAGGRADFEALGDGPAACTFRIERVLIDHLPPGPVSDFDGETVFHVAHEAFDQVLRELIAAGQCERRGA